MPVVIGGDNLPSPVRIGLTDLQNIGGGGSGPPGPPGSGTTELASNGPEFESKKWALHLSSSQKVPCTVCRLRFIVVDSLAGLGF